MYEDWEEEDAVAHITPVSVFSCLFLLFSHVFSSFLNFLRFSNVLKVDGLWLNED